MCRGPTTCNALRRVLATDGRPRQCAVVSRGMSQTGVGAVGPPARPSPDVRRCRARRRAGRRVAGSGRANRSRRGRRGQQAVVRPCPGRARVLCGVIEVPLYWSTPLRGSLHVHFKVFLHTDTSRHALAPIVAMEGGPDYP